MYLCRLPRLCMVQGGLRRFGSAVYRVLHVATSRASGQERAGLQARRDSEVWMPQSYKGLFFEVFRSRVLLRISLKPSSAS